PVVFRSDLRHRDPASGQPESIAVADAVALANSERGRRHGSALVRDRPQLAAESRELADHLENQRGRDASERRLAGLLEESRRALRVLTRTRRSPLGAFSKGNAPFFCPAGLCLTRAFAEPAHDADDFREADRLVK